VQFVTFGSVCISVIAFVLVYCNAVTLITDLICALFGPYAAMILNLSWKIVENEFCESWKTLEFGLCKSWKVLENSILLSVRTLLQQQQQQQQPHTHNHFTALLDFVRDCPGEPAPER